jgi:hypothetical protein
MTTLFTRESDFRTQYELAKREGDKRFGSPCNHEQTRNGQCMKCLRKGIISKGSR